MALLDHQVPEEAKQVTVDLLQKCVGNVCVVKYRRDTGSMKFHAEVACGMVSLVGVPDGRELEASFIRLFEGATTASTIQGDSIEYIYSLSMLPGAMPPEMADFIGPMQES